MEGRFVEMLARQDGEGASFNSSFLPSCSSVLLLRSVGVVAGGGGMKG